MESLIATSPYRGEGKFTEACIDMVITAIEFRHRDSDDVPFTISIYRHDPQGPLVFSVITFTSMLYLFTPLDCSGQCIYAIRVSCGDEAILHGFRD